MISLFFILVTNKTMDFFKKKQQKLASIAELQAAQAHHRRWSRRVSSQLEFIDDAADTASSSSPSSSSDDEEDDKQAHPRRSRAHSLTDKLKDLMHHRAKHAKPVELEDLHVERDKSTTTDFSAHCLYMMGEFVASSFNDRLELQDMLVSGEQDMAGMDECHSLSLVDEPEPLPSLKHMDAVRSELNFATLDGKKK